mgnify:CR=1 FL=1
MQKENKDRVQRLLLDIQDVCNSILTNLFTLGTDLNTKTLMSVAYSPLTDIVYVYCRDSYSGHLLLFELTRQLKEGRVEIENISSDTICNRFVIELEFKSKDQIALNKIEDKIDVETIDERHL